MESKNVESVGNLAILYLRSSKDRHDVSIDAQRRILQEDAASKGLAIVGEYTDVVESAKDEDRPGFRQLVAAIGNRHRGWTNILVLNTSRIARRGEFAHLFGFQCMKSGISVHYNSIPDDMSPPAKALLKAVYQGFDEWHSLESREKALDAMKENTLRGWRAGGRAPFGYTIKRIPTGAIREGLPVMKSTLVPNDDAPLVQAYLQARARGESRTSVVRRLNMQWKSSSLNYLEWRALTYAGHMVWNVHNPRTRGQYVTGYKRKPRSAWIMKPNAHEALITEHEAEVIVRTLEQGKTRRTRSSEHCYPLSGLLVDRERRRWHGDWDHKMQRTMYRLQKGPRISARAVESAVVRQIVEDLSQPDVIRRLTMAMKESTEQQVDGRKISGLEKRITNLQQKVANLVGQLAEAGDSVAAVLTQAIARFEDERQQSVRELRELREKHAVASKANALTEEDVRQLLRALSDQLQEVNPAERPSHLISALCSLVDQVTLDPETRECFVRYLRDHCPPEPGREDT